jgi:hypothetical protein
VIETHYKPMVVNKYYEKAYQSLKQQSIELGNSFMAVSELGSEFKIITLVESRIFIRTTLIGSQIFIGTTLVPEYFLITTVLY